MTTKMNLLGSLKNKLSNQINDTSGAIDIIVIQNENGLLASTPFYCKFGRVLIPKSTELVVDVKINDQFVSTFRMAFDENGDSAYIQNSFKSILEDKKLDHEGKNHSKSDSSIDYYLKAAKALENAINKIDTEPIESNSSEPFFYIQLSDSEKIHDPITSNDKCVENNTLIKKNYYVDLKSKNTSKLFELTSDQLKCFKLKKGINEIKYLLNTTVNVKTVCAYIYLWKDTDKLVISDLDGTITKSDVRGQILTRIGRDWSHSDVAELYQNIEKKGYKFIYLSARSLCQSESTRNLIESLKQEKYSLPKGPLLLNPNDLLSCFASEIYHKNSNEFKISSLNNLKFLFKENPFYAGFGNRLTDLITYRTIGIDDNLIFIVDQNGFVNEDNKLTYKKLINYVDYNFTKV